MFVVCVKVWVKPDHLKEFIQATLANARGARTEPGNLRFDVLQCQGTESEFMFYEVYQNEEALRAHQQTEHYLTWRAAVEPWMAQPRQGSRYMSLFPDDQDWE